MVGFPRCSAPSHRHIVTLPVNILTFPIVFSDFPGYCGIRLHLCTLSCTFACFPTSSNAQGATMQNRKKHGSDEGWQGLRDAPALLRSRGEASVSLRRSLSGFDGSQPNSPSDRDPLQRDTRSKRCVGVAPRGRPEPSRKRGKSFNPERPLEAPRGEPQGALWVS